MCPFIYANRIEGRTETGIRLGFRLVANRRPGPGARSEGSRTRREVELRVKGIRETAVLAFQA